MGIPESNETLIKLQELISSLNTIFQTPSIYLTGSCVSYTHSPKSDIDLLVITKLQDPKQKDSLLVNFLPKISPDLMSKLDCKVITYHEASQARPLDYLYLISSIKSGHLLSGSSFSTSLSPIKLRDAVLEIEENLESIRLNLHNQRNFSSSAFLLCSLLKSSFYLSRIIQPGSSPFSQNSFTEMMRSKKISWICDISSQLKPPGFQYELHSTLMHFPQKSGNYHKLQQGFDFAIELFSSVQTQFYEWLDKNSDT
jgi:predicted nucleotidyltransferase